MDIFVGLIGFVEVDDDSDRKGEKYDGAIDLIVVVEPNDHADDDEDVEWLHNLTGKEDRNGGLLDNHGSNSKGFPQVLHLLIIESEDLTFYIGFKDLVNNFFVVESSGPHCIVPNDVFHVSVYEVRYFPLLLLKVPFLLFHDVFSVVEVHDEKICACVYGSGGVVQEFSQLRVPV